MQDIIAHLLVMMGNNDGLDRRGNPGNDNDVNNIR